MVETPLYRRAEPRIKTPTFSCAAGQGINTYESDLPRVTSYFQKVSVKRICRGSSMEKLEQISLRNASNSRLIEPCAPIFFIILCLIQVSIIVFECEILAF